MRLIDVETLELRLFIGQEIPPYATLSHTWGDEEVSFLHFATRAGTERKGYQKIVQCCSKARNEGYDYVWIDTCCIDTASSAELSEAINSMFKWYEQSEICYAYLSDVDSREDPELDRSTFRRSRWFTRGWTLQELLAPAEVVFLGSDWGEVGSKELLKYLVSQITGISEAHLAVPTILSSLDQGWRSASVAQKLSWASKRTTTRIEDEAYCLMGLFTINMPLLYGEGANAFQRLQHQIINSSDDQSILVWNPSYQEGRTNFTTMGLLASSPRNFAWSFDIKQLSGQQAGTHRSAADGLLDYDDPPLEIASTRLRVSARIFRFEAYNRRNPQSHFRPNIDPPFRAVLHDVDAIQHRSGSPLSKTNNIINDEKVQPVDESDQESHSPLILVLNCTHDGVNPIGLNVIPSPDRREVYVRSHCRRIYCDMSDLQHRVPYTTIQCLPQFQFQHYPMPLESSVGTHILLRYPVNPIYGYSLCKVVPGIGSRNRVETKFGRQQSIVLGGLASGDVDKTQKPRSAYLVFSSSIPSFPSFGILLYRQFSQLWVCFRGNVSPQEESFYDVVEALRTTSLENKLSALQELEPNSGDIAKSKVLKFALFEKVVVFVRLRKVRAHRTSVLRDAISVIVETTN